MNAKKPREQRAPKAGPINLVQGYKDRLPADAQTWEHIQLLVERLRVDFGYTPVATPIIEEARLYAPTKAGVIIPQEQLITFEDRDGTLLALRPENTLALARAYREHGYSNLPQPIKLFYQGPQFRYVPRYGSGSYRQFMQFGFEIFGDPQPVVDAQMIGALFFFFQELSLDARLHINSIGHPECRTQYEKTLLEYFRTRKSELCDACKVELANKQPLALMTCAMPHCQEMLVQVPQIVDSLCDPDREHFVRVLEHLDEVEVSYELDPLLFRSSVTHNKTVVEFRAPLPDGTQLALAAGGRHDQLVAVAGGEPTPAFGLAGGYERIVVALRGQGRMTPLPQPPDVFLAQLGDAARRKSLQLFLKLRTEGIRVSESLSRDGIKGQLENAAQRRAKFALILGQKEIMDGTILLRDMENGIQEVLDFQKVIPELKKRLAKAIPASVTIVPPELLQKSPPAPQTPS